MPTKKQVRCQPLSWFLILATVCACHAPSRSGMRRTPYPVSDNLGQPRTYRLFVPPACHATSPLLVYFQGVWSEDFRKIPTLKNYTGSPIEETGLIPFCQEKGIILLVPDALYEYTFLHYPAKGWLIDKEMAGVEMIIDAVVKNFAVDRERIFLAGISAGAVFCHFLANHRPEFYCAILSHSQAYVDQQGKVLTPARPGPGFGILFCYNRRDYPNLIRFVIASEEIYRQRNFRTVLLADLLPEGHRWAYPSNSKFWYLLQKIARRF